MSWEWGTNWEMSIFTLGARKQQNTRKPAILRCLLALSSEKNTLFFFFVLQKIVCEENRKEKIQ